MAPTKIKIGRYYSNKRGAVRVVLDIFLPSDKENKTKRTIVQYQVIEATPNSKPIGTVDTNYLAVFARWAREDDTHRQLCKKGW